MNSRKSNNPKLQSPKNPSNTSITSNTEVHLDEYASYKSEVDRISPYLLETRWYPMTYMVIPKLLKDADDLIARMENAKLNRDQDNLIALTEKLKYLRSTFARIVSKA